MPRRPPNWKVLLNRFFVAVKKIHHFFVQQMFGFLLDIVLADEEKLFWPQLFLASKVKGLPLQKTSFCLMELPALCNYMSKQSHTWFYGQINLNQKHVNRSNLIVSTPTSPNITPLRQKEIHMLDFHPIWNFSSNKQSSPPTSPNIVCVTKKTHILQGWPLS